MTIFVTGGAGFIGSNFLNLSVPRCPEHHFVCVDKLTYAANLASLKAVSNAPNYMFERIDIADGPVVRNLFERYRPDMVVHFAAESHVDRSITSPEDFVRTNIEGTFQLLEAFRSLESGPDQLFHHVSTDEVYGSLGEHGAFTESTSYDPSSPYSASKAASDHLVRAYGRTYGIPFKVTNCSNNYGPYQFPEKLIPLMVLHAFERRPLPVYGEGLNVRDWLYVEDHCEAIWQVIRRGKVGETYNIGANSERTNIDVVRDVCRIVAEETECAQAELEALITFVADRPGHDLRYAIDASKLRRECDWEPRETFDSGLRRTVRWYLENPFWVEHVRSGEYRKWMEENYENRQA
jgi:dTDP-glucose 4,6-dehydratase